MDRIQGRKSSFSSTIGADNIIVPVGFKDFHLHTGKRQETRDGDTIYKKRESDKTLFPV